MNTRSILATTLTLLVVLTFLNCRGRIAPPTHKSEDIIVFLNVNLVPMTAKGTVEDQTVVVKGNRIVATGSSKQIAVPENSKVIDGAGAYLMPGLADMHMHTSDNWALWMGDWPVSPLLLYLANGVTTIRCFGPETSGTVLGWRDKIQTGKLAGPTIYTSGPIIYGPVNNPEESVLEQKMQGVDFVKLYSFLSADEFHRAMAAAKQAGIYTAGHIPFQVGLAGVLAEGMDEIAHVEELSFELIDLDRNRQIKGREWMPYVIKTAFQQSQPYMRFSLTELDEKFGDRVSSVAARVQFANISVCTTLYLDEVIVEKLHESEKFLSKPENKYLPRKYIAAVRQGRDKHQRQFRGGEDFAFFKRRLDLLLLKHLKESNVTLVLGTDSGTGWMGLAPGFSIHDELQVLTQNGFTPYEAIKTGTVNAARVVEAMNRNGDFGTIAIGKRADLLLVKDNPLEDVANIRNILGVMASGRWYDKTMLQKMIE